MRFMEPSTPLRCLASIPRIWSRLKKRAASSDANAAFTRSWKRSSRSQPFNGTGKPSFFLFAVRSGISLSAVRRRATLVFSSVTLKRAGIRRATSQTFLSRNGTRSSRLCAIDMRSALSRMS